MAKQTQDAVTQTAVMAINDLAAYLMLSESTFYKLGGESKVLGQKVELHWWFHQAVIDHRLGGSQQQIEKAQRP